jgi:hypothetical protein
LCIAAIDFASAKDAFGRNYNATAAKPAGANRLSAQRLIEQFGEAQPAALDL